MTQSKRPAIFREDGTLRGISYQKACPPRRGAALCLSVGRKKGLKVGLVNSLMLLRNRAARSGYPPEILMIHARPDYNRIQDPANLIPADMPVFLLVGKDKHAAAPVRFWADAVEADGGHPEIVRIARAHADLMAALPCHKQPDLPARLQERKG